MIEAYSRDITVTAMQAIPFNNVTFKKGCTVTQSGAATFALNKCGTYQVNCSVDAAETETIQLYVNGVPSPQTRKTGNSPSFSTLVPVRDSNSCRCCDSPTTIQVISVTAATLPDALITVTKIC